MRVWSFSSQIVDAKISENSFTYTNLCRFQCVPGLSDQRALLVAVEMRCGCLSHPAPETFSVLEILAAVILVHDFTQPDEFFLAGTDEALLLVACQLFLLGFVRDFAEQRVQLAFAHS